MSSKKVKPCRRPKEVPRSTIEMLAYLREVLVNDLSCVKSRLGGSPLIFEDNRLFIAKKFLFLSYLIGEVNILYATVWRYVCVEHTATVLDAELILVIEEIEKVHKKLESLIQDGTELTSLYFKGLLSNCYKFFVIFDARLEECLSTLVELVPFEIRIVDLLSCCPTIDVKLSIVRPSYQSSYVSLKAEYKMYDVECFYGRPDVCRKTTQLGRQSEFVKFFRECVRCANVTYIQKIVNDLSSDECRLNFSSGDQRIGKLKELCECYEYVIENLYQLHTHSSFTSTIGKKNFITDMYVRKSKFDVKPCLAVQITFPYLRTCFLPLMLRALPDYSSCTDDTQVQSLENRFIRTLKEYNFSHGITEKPQVRLMFYRSADLKECNIVASYDRNNTFIANLNEN